MRIYHESPALKSEIVRQLCGKWDGNDWYYNSLILRLRLRPAGEWLATYEPTYMTMVAYVHGFLWKCWYLGYSQISWIITLPIWNGPLGSFGKYTIFSHPSQSSWDFPDQTIPMLEAIFSADAAWWPHSGGPLAPKWQRSQIKTSDAQSNPSTASNPKTSSDSSADLEKLYRRDQYCTIL